MEIKTDISLQTKQVLSQVQMQSLNILSMSMTELEEFLQNEEIENPLVEYSSGRQEGELPVAYREYDRFYNGASREGDSRGEIYEADDTEQSVEHMIMMQLPWKTLTEEQHRIVKFCIHSLDQNGYLTVPPSEIAEALKAEVSEVEYIVSRLKELEPVGIFASSLEECLVLQVLGMEQEAALCTIIRNHLQDVADGKVSTISRRLKLSSVEVRKLIHVIRNLNPRPLNGYGGDRAQYVFPDIILSYQDGQWTVSLNDKWAGNISINEFYVHMMETAQDEELKNYFEEKLKRARFIMNAVEQRRRTLEGITEGILKRQAGYFLGKEPLKPMTLEEIAAEREIHKSTVSRAIRDKYILTPASPETPQINNPLVYGARPGNPFLMPVMASGKRPMAYGAQGLPEGLELDPRTGLITGRVPAEGDFRVLLTAENALGKAEREILLKIGPQIALTPPMGWNSWNCWGFSVDDAKVRDAARAMHEKLLVYGWTYVNIDDGWPADTRSADGRLLPNEKFPDFKGLSDYVHSLGLKFGIYSSPGPTTCGNYPGSYRHELTDVRTWAEWGVDYLKHDYCGYLQIERDSEEKTIQEPYVVMRKALDQVDRDIVYCVGYGAPNVWNWGAEAGGNLWRTTRDITDEWNVVTAIGCFQDVCAQATAPGRYNDPDMLVVGRLGHGWGADAHESELTPDEQYAHISLWAILSAPLLIGCDMRAIDDFTLGLLTNSEVIAVNQDPLVAPAVKRVIPNGQVWYKKLCDGSYALGFFQLDPYFVLWDQDEAEAIQEQNYEFEFDLRELGIGGKAEVRDLWRQQDLGTCTGTLRALVPYHGVSLVRITPVE